jgi:hypothetical protein
MLCSLYRILKLLQLNKVNLKLMVAGLSFTEGMLYTVVGGTSAEVPALKRSQELKFVPSENQGLTEVSSKKSQSLGGYRQH